jgi:hypothetical protein
MLFYFTYTYTLCSFSQPFAVPPYFFFTSVVQLNCFAHKNLSSPSNLVSECDRCIGFRMAVEPPNRKYYQWLALQRQWRKQFSTSKDMEATFEEVLSPDVLFQPGSDMSSIPFYIGNSDLYTCRSGNLFVLNSYLHRNESGGQFLVHYCAVRLYAGYTTLFTYAHGQSLQRKVVPHAV